MRSALEFVSTALLTAMVGSAQVDWTRLVPSASPSARTKASLAHDYATGRMLMFGGLDRSWTTLDETWVFDGSRWTRLQPSTVPPGRWDHATASDLVRQRIVLFSGWSGSIYHPDTWEWDGQDWVQLQPSNSPTPRDHHAMTFDAGRNRTVMFGGWSHPGRTLYDDTWEWDGQDWSLIATSSAPSPRDGHAICYDFARGETVLFGGGRESATRFGDTWTYDGATWTRRSPASSPSPRTGHRMTFDLDRDVVVLFGGWDGPSSASRTYFNDVWEWDGRDWNRRTTQTSPAPRANADIVFDPTSRSIIQASGDNAGGGGGAFGETWRYAPLFRASSGTFGTGCPGSAGLPTLVSSRPWLGGSYVLTLSNLSPSHPAFLVLGFSNSTSTVGPLPYGLAAAGMPGCALLVDPVLALTVANVSGSSQTTLPIPQDPLLLGRSVYAQGFPADPGVNRLGLVASNGASATIGGK